MRTLKKQSLVVALMTLGAVAALATACPNTPPAGEGEGEGEGAAAGEGEGAAAGEGEGAAGEGEGAAAGEGEGEGGGPNSCQADGDCEADEACDSVFNGAAGKSCFKTCSNLGDSCTSIAGTTGTCENFDPNGVAPHICVVQAGDREPCGDVVNAQCGDNTQDHEAVCVTPSDNPNTPQNETAVSYCLVACSDTVACVNAGEDCSQDITFRIGAGTDSFGSCAPISTDGEACGLANDGATICTGTSRCVIPDGTNAGVCTAQP
ncbi:MAG TPA: hypothetical protein VGO62_21405 [Myxococcota bacterium]